VSEVWLRELGAVGEIVEGDTESVMIVGGRRLPLERVMTTGQTLGHFVISGARYVAMEGEEKHGEGKLDIFEQVDPQAEGGVSVWHICEPDYVAGRVLNACIAWYVKTTGVEAGELDFEAVPEDLETLIYPDDGTEPRTFRQIIRAEHEAGSPLPFLACSCEV
jgi:hypothetical protein